MENKTVALNWLTPGHKTAFSGRGNLFRHYRGRIGNKEILNTLEHIPSYTVKREQKKVKIFNPYLVYEKRKLFQADLVDFGSLNESARFKNATKEIKRVIRIRKNENVRFWLVVIGKYL